MLYNLSILIEIKEKLGRPMMGIEVYANYNLHSSRLSRSDNHISIKFNNFVINGVHFQPESEIDHIVESLLVCIDQAKSYLKKNIL